MPAKPPLAPPRRPRLKFMLLGAAGGALVLAPLGQVLRYQGAELRELADQRAALDPVAVVVGVQRGLLAHRDVADRVLRGRAALEPERRERQADLDERLRHLQDTLTAGLWARALQESQSLVMDWRLLARRLVQKQVTVDASLERHQLLMEQAVQVLDLVQAAAPSPTTALVAQAVHQAPVGDRELASLEAALQSLDASLTERQAQVAEQRAAVATALIALMALMTTALVAALARARRAAHEPDEPGPGTGPGADPEQRRSHGRRATDAAPQRDETAPLLDRLRSGQLPRTPEPR